MELHVSTGQLHVVNGELRGRAAVPGLLAQRAPSDAVRSRQDDLLFLHLSLSGPAEEAGDQLAALSAAIAGRFYQAPGSVTAALRTAIVETNQQLLAENLTAGRPRREGAVTCAVLRGAELYTAQAGEAVALLGHNFGVERLPPAEPRRTTPLGLTAGLDIRYFHHWLQPGVTLLLADPQLSHLPGDQLAPALIDTEIADGLAALTTLIGAGSARLLLVEFAGEAGDFEPEALPAAAAPPATRPTPPRSRPLRATEPSPPPVNPAAPTRPKPAFTEEDLEALELGARQATSQVTRGLARGTGWLARFLTRLRPPQARPDETRGWTLPAALAVILPLLVATIVTSVYLERGQVARYAEIKQAMSQLLLQAQQSADPALAIASYEEVVRLAAEGETLRPGDPDATAMRQQALDQLDVLTGVGRLRTTVLYTYDPAVSLQAIALGDELNGDIYTLDAAGNAVYRHETDGNYEGGAAAPEQVLAGDAAVGSHIVGQLVDMIWRPRGQQVSRDGLAMLDGRGALVTFHPSFNDTRAVPLGLASGWVRPRAVATFSERLYILDPGAAAIWRYFPEGDGLTVSEGQRAVEFVEDAGLSAATDLVIYSEDGSVILSYGDGRLRRYANGRRLWGETELANNGLETPLVSPQVVRFAGSGLNTSLYVLDPGSGRLIQFSLGGTFLAQYRATDDEGRELFAEATDFEVASNPLRVFAVAGNKLYSAALP